MGLLVQLDPIDNVAIATAPITPGQSVPIGNRSITAKANVARGHKIAVKPIPLGAAVTKYGQPIGAATAEIAVGDHVHSHNLTDHHEVSGNIQVFIR